MAAMSFACNTLVVLTVARSQSLRQPSLLMLCSLSITDVIFAIYVLVRDALIMTDPHFCSEPFKEHGTSRGILCYLATAISSLAMISRDRYLAVSKSSWYPNDMTRSHAFKEIILSWLASMMATVFSYKLFFVVIFLFYVICFFMIVFNYVRYIFDRK